jgi:hypothetical protein
MNQGLWIARKNQLCILIKQVSDGFGGDDIDFLRQHCKHMLNEHQGELIEDAIICYTEMCEQIKHTRR